MNGPFNAIDYTQQLEAAGVPQAQAEVHSKMLALALVSCAASRADLAALGDKLNCRIDSVRQELSDRIDSLEQKLSARMDLIEQEIRNLRKQLYWMFGLNTSLIVAVLVKQFFP